MVKALADEGFAEKVTVRQAGARNCQLTVSGYSPLETATGRRPPDLLDVETGSPEQLSVDLLLRIGPLWNSRELP